MVRLKPIEHHPSTIDRFFSRLHYEPNTGCWLWEGCWDSYGYGQMWNTDSRKVERVYRISYEIHNGVQVPDDLIVRHKCDTPACANPAHLEIGTKADNMDDKIKRGRCNYQVGSKIGAAKLTEEDVEEIRKIPSSVSSAKIARNYGVDRGTIRSARKKISWKHVE